MSINYLRIVDKYNIHSKAMALIGQLTAEKKIKIWKHKKADISNRQTNCLVVNFAERYSIYRIRNYTVEHFKGLFLQTQFNALSPFDQLI